MSFLSPKGLTFDFKTIFPELFGKGHIPAYEAALRDASISWKLPAITFSSCKKDKDAENEPDSSSIFAYQGKTIVVGDADYRKGNGDGAWIYFTSKDFTGVVQMRFKGLVDFAIPIGSFSYKSKASINPYDPAKNFEGGQVGIDNVYDEFSGGTVKIGKYGEQYTIELDIATKNGSLKGLFKGTLKKI